MKVIAIILFAFTACVITACTKTGIPTVVGTINGVPSLSLYGTSNLPVDYILLSSNAAIKEISYDGVVYTYLRSPGNGIYISVSPTIAVAGTIDTAGGKTTITLDPPFNPFASSQYASR